MNKCLFVVFLVWVRGLQAIAPLGELPSSQTIPSFFVATPGNAGCVQLDTEDAQYWASLALAAAAQRHLEEAQQEENTSLLAEQLYSR